MVHFVVVAITVFTSLLPPDESLKSTLLLPGGVLVMETFVTTLFVHV